MDKKSEVYIVNIHLVYKPVGQSFYLDLSSGTINAEEQTITTVSRKKSWEETMEDVLLDRAEAWSKLADHPTRFSRGSMSG